MNLLPKMLAAADMCDAGEEVNLDEMAFLLRYAADELTDRPQAVEERDRLLEALRNRVIARCELLEKGQARIEDVKHETLEELETLDEELEIELQRRFSDICELNAISSESAISMNYSDFQSGR